MVQAFTSGAVQATMVNEGCTVTMVNVSTWKREVIGNGSASKEDVAQGVRLRWPTFIRGAGGDEDLIDAAAIALWGKSNLPE
jgi:Holliday junction resolvasome RuvABC endonuclease subunit